MTIFRNPTVIAATVAAIATIISVGLNLWMSRRNRRLTDELEVTRSFLGFKKQQIDQFYGPLMSISKQNTQLANRIKDYYDKEGHLIEQLPAILDRPEIRELVDVMTKNNDKIEELLLTKSSLILGDGYPDSFTHFLGHCRILRNAINGKPLPKLKSEDYFPKAFNENVERGFEELKRQINSIFKS